MGIDKRKPKVYPFTSANFQIWVCQALTCTFAPSYDESELFLRSSLRSSDSQSNSSMNSEFILLVFTVLAELLLLLLALRRSGQTDLARDTEQRRSARELLHSFFVRFFELFRRLADLSWRVRK